MEQRTALGKWVSGAAIAVGGGLVLLSLLITVVGAFTAGLRGLAAVAVVYDLPLGILAAALLFLGRRVRRKLPSTL